MYFLQYVCWKVDCLVDKCYVEQDLYCYCQCYQFIINVVVDWLEGVGVMSGEVYFDGVEYYVKIICWQVQYLLWCLCFIYFIDDINLI